MSLVRTVLCPVGFSETGKATLRLGSDLCAATGARLVAHHNIAGVPPGLAAAWMWDEEHRPQIEKPEDVEAALQDLLADAAPGVQSEAVVTSGGFGHSLVELAATIPADVVVFGLCEKSTPEEEEVVERLMRSGTCAVLTFHAGRRTPTFASGGVPQPVTALVATDFGEEASEAVREAFDLARQVPLDLHLLYADTRAGAGGRAEEDRRRLRELVPPDLADRVSLHVDARSPAEAIPAVAEEMGADLIFMGEHTHRLLRRFLTADTARAVLHRAPCAVWFARSGVSSRS